jgi:ketosteroid isomerase-like protein
MKHAIVPFLLLITVAGCNNQTDTKADEQTLRQICEDWSKSAAAGDSNKALFYWANDAIVMGDGMPTINGIDSIRSMYMATKNIPGFKMEWDPPISITVSKSGDLAYIISANHLTMNDSTGHPITRNNRALLVWKKEPDKSWKEVAVMFNADPVYKNKPL